MRKAFSLFLVGCLVILHASAQWQAVNRNKSDGSGEIPAKVNFMAIADGKLYAATTDGIWESASMNGGDWTAFGLQGQEVKIINFSEEKLAIINVTAAADESKTAGQLYKYNAGNWELTKFNETREAGFQPSMGFVQIRDTEDKLIFVLPTWGQGIWRSEDGGETWTQSPTLTDEGGLTVCKNTIGLFTFENDPVIYGTDKASGSVAYLLRSFDYGKTWEYKDGGYVFNPWSFHKRMYNGVETYYFGGENGNHSVQKSIDQGNTWVDFSGQKAHNRCMLGKDDGPLYVMFGQDGVYVSKDDGASLEELGTGFVITNAHSKSLTHMVMTDTKLYCSSQEDGIQVFNISGYNVVTKAGNGGSITETEGVYTITPDENYRIHTVFVNDKVYGPIAPAGATTTLNFTEPGDYTVTATFLPVSEVDVWDGTTVSESLQGSGTAADPYQINSCADWVYLSDHPELFTTMKEFILTKHLDFNNQRTPIVGHKGKWNNVSNVNEPFVGFFNGNNKTFININILSESANNVPTGLFGSISGDTIQQYNSVICNLGIVSGTVNSSNNTVGGIVGSIEGLSTADFLDGKAYAFAGSIFNCYNYATINKQREESGGIFGRRNGTNFYLLQDVMLANCYNRGKTSNGIGGKGGNTEYPCYSVYNSSDTYDGNYYFKLVREGTLLNSYYDTIYIGGQASSVSFGMSAQDMCTQRMADLLNASPNAPYYNQKAWVIDPAGIINAGKPYLNNAYRVYSATGEKIFIPAAGYHPQLAYEGDSYKFWALVEGTIKVNGSPIIPDADGYYTVENVNGKLEISCDDAKPGNISLWDGQSIEEIKTGDGSPENPYQISNAAQFIWVAMNMKSTETTPKTSDSFILTTDIDFNGFYHPTIASQGGNGFSGTFDGQGHKFFNLRIKNKLYTVPTGEDSNLGLFGKIAGASEQTNCVVKNIMVESGSIYGNRALGGIAGTCTSAGSTKVIFENNVVRNMVIRSASSSSTSYGPYAGLIAGKVLHSNCEFKNNYGFGKYTWSFADGTDEPEGGMPKSHQSGALIGYVTNAKPLLNSNYAVFFHAPDQLFHTDKNGGVAANSTSNYYLGTDPTYGKSEEELKSAAMVDSLNYGQRKVWTRNDNVNNGFPFFNKTYAVSLPTIENGAFEPVEFCEANVTYEGDNYLFRVIPADSLRLSDDFKVLVNGEALTANEEGVYVVENVQEKLTVTYEGNLVVKTFEIELSAGEGGNIEVAEGSINPVTYGENATFNFVPEEGYLVKQVLVDGEEQEVSDSYTFEYVTATHTLEVLFEKQSFEITLSASEGGEIVLDEGSANPVAYGENATFNFVPQEGYHVKQVKVDGEDKGVLESYTFENVTEAHTLEVVFEENQSGLAGLHDGAVSVLYREGVLTLDGHGTTINKVAVYTLTGALLREQTVGNTFMTMPIDIPTTAFMVTVEVKGMDRMVFKMVNE